MKRKPKIAFSMIVFNGDYVLEPCLESVYPFADQVLVAEGPVTYWQQRGYTTSTDRTNEILHEFPDPDKKIKIVHGQWGEKDQQANGALQNMDPDVDILWNLDSDEIWKAHDIQAIIDLIWEEKYTSVGVQSCTFFGGFADIMTGWEQKQDQFLRVFRTYLGSRWLTHRPPTMQHSPYVTQKPKHMDSKTLMITRAVEMYHYSYVFPSQVKQKVEYYKRALTKERCIDDYYEKVWLPWAQIRHDPQANPLLLNELEHKYNGVHEYKPEYRESTFTQPFMDHHPPAIEKRLHELQARWEKEIAEEPPWKI